MRIEVRGRVPGQQGDELPAVDVEIGDGAVTLAELIGRAVEEQVRRLAADRVRCRAALDRQYLSAEDVRAQAPTGVVRLPAAAPDVPDAATEAARARAAFQRGVFVVFAGGRQVERLDEPVALRPDEPVVFLRLTPLVGG